MLLFNLNFETSVRYLVQIYTPHTFNVCVKLYWKNTRHSSIGETLCFSLITKLLFPQEFQRKVLDLVLSIQPNPLNLSDNVEYFSFVEAIKYITKYVKVGTG